MAAESGDKALEILFYKYFNVDAQQKSENMPTVPELLEMRMDEKAVLESIYDNSFKIKENNLWIVKLNLDYLTKMYENKEIPVPKKKENINYNKTKKKELCKLYLKGPCRFGAKCKFLHERNENVENDKKNDSETQKSTKITYELEIRFPDDSVYPFQVPILFFKSEHPTSIIPELTFLRITARLVEEAKTLAQDGIPSIYSIVELLNNEEEIQNFIKFDTRTFPVPTDALFPEILENSGPNKPKPSHYKKGDTKDHRTTINFEDVLKENREIAKNWSDKKRNNKYSKMLAGRRKLPAWTKRKEILNAVRQSQVG